MCTLQGDCSPGSNSSRVLITDSVVPQRRCRDGRCNVGQTDDEIVRSSGLTEIHIHRYTYELVAAQIKVMLVFLEKINEKRQVDFAF